MRRCLAVALLLTFAWSSDPAGQSPGTAAPITADTDQGSLELERSVRCVLPARLERADMAAGYACEVPDEGSIPRVARVSAFTTIYKPTASIRTIPFIVLVVSRASGGPVAYNIGAPAIRQADGTTRFVSRDLAPERLDAVIRLLAAGKEPARAFLGIVRSDRPPNQGAYYAVEIDLAAVSRETGR